MYHYIFTILFSLKQNNHWSGCRQISPNSAGAGLSQCSVDPHACYTMVTVVPTLSIGS